MPKNSDVWGTQMPTNQAEAEQLIKDLLCDLPDDDTRHPIIHESIDLLTHFGRAIEILFMSALEFVREGDTDGLALNQNTRRLIMESLYVLAYQAGRAAEKEHAQLSRLFAGKDWTDAA